MTVSKISFSLNCSLLDMYLLRKGSLVQIPHIREDLRLVDLVVLQEETTIIRGHHPLEQPPMALGLNNKVSTLPINLMKKSIIRKQNKVS
jgi:hypothetical protein